MVMALNGQRTAHFLQPVQASMSFKTENFSQPCRSSESKCRWHVGTHQPQPVQRLVSITGLGTGRDGFMSTHHRPAVQEINSAQRLPLTLNP